MISNRSSVTKQLPKKKKRKKKRKEKRTEGFVPNKKKKTTFVHRKKILVMIYALL